MTGGAIAAAVASGAAMPRSSVMPTLRPRESYSSPARNAGLAELPAPVHLVLLDEAVAALRLDDLRLGPHVQLEGGARLVAQRGEDRVLVGLGHVQRLLRDVGRLVAEAVEVPVLDPGEAQVHRAEQASCR